MDIFRRELQFVAAGTLWILIDVINWNSYSIILLFNQALKLLILTVRHRLIFLTFSSSILPLRSFQACSRIQTVQM
jgi:hypothetical protein